MVWKVERHSEGALKKVSPEANVIPVGGSYMYITARDISHVTLDVHVIFSIPNIGTNANL